MTSTDGRTARKDRNSDAVLDTVLELFEEGNLVPNVELVAARSGVSLRSVYRYFEDTEALLRAAIARRIDHVEPLFALPDLGVGTVAERVVALVDHRLALYDSMRPALRAALLRAPQAPLIAEQVARRRSFLYDQVVEHFAGLGSSTALSLIDVLCEFESMEHLRVQRGLTPAETRDVLIAGVTRLLGEP